MANCSQILVWHTTGLWIELAERVLFSFQLNLKSVRSFSSTSFCTELGNRPNSRRISEVESVNKRCRRIVEERRRPVVGKVGVCSLSSTSEPSDFLGARLVIKARTTWRCGPVGSVRQTAGLTLEVDRSSKGKGTRTILPLVIEWLSIIQRINVFVWIF